jgi:hypothetical protein
LLPFRGMRRRTCLLLGTLVIIGGMLGCGYVPNSASPNSYHIVVTATSENQANIAINIPLSTQ